MKIQLYNGVKDNKGNQVEVDSIIQTITAHSMEFPIAKVRKAYADLLHAKQLHEAGTIDEGEVIKLQKLYDDEKRSLPAVTWSGTFSKRNAKSLIDYSGRICIDIDKLTPQGLQDLRKQLCKDKFTWLLFVSPSGNGLKVVVLVPGSSEQHKDYFLALEQYYKENYGIEIDPSGKDVSRLCFLSSDKDIFHNKAAKAFLLSTKATETPAPAASAPAPKKSKPATEKITGQTPNDIFESTQKVIQYVDGSRNEFVHKFACNCNRVGISQTECLAFAEGFANDLQPTEIKATVNSAYTHNINEHGKFKKQSGSGTKSKPGVSSKPAALHTGTSTNNGTNKTGKTPGPQNNAAQQDSKNEPDYKFWKEITVEKGRGDNKKTYTRLELSRVDFCNFLKDEGFHLLKTGDEEGFQIVHSANGIIKPVTPQQIKHYSLDWCRQYGLKEVEEMLRKGQTKYFAKNELDSLPYKDVELKKDTADFSYFYFDNCCIQIDTTGNITEIPYSNVKGFIWESNKIKHSWQRVDLNIINDQDELLPYSDINCEFARFIALASYNPHNEEEKDFSRKLITQRFFSFCSSIGWLLDGYKHPANRTSIFAIDHKIGERNEANGRTGKSMIPQACEQMKKVAHISGKSYDPKYQFCDEPITVDSQIINYNDMPRNFDVENIFEKIADPYSVNRRNQGFIYFKYSDSPKVYYSTNFIPKGEGESYKSRMNIIEFSDYFSGTNTPYDEFKHGFFDESWPAEEWQRFFNFMVWCVSYYKECGLVAYPHPNMEARKLINDVVPEFIDFMEDSELVPKNTPHEKIVLLEKFNDVYIKLYSKKLTAHSFTSWLRKFCTTKGYTLNPKQKGKFDKRNSKEFITIADSNWKDEQTKLL